MGRSDSRVGILSCGIAHVTESTGGPVKTATVCVRACAIAVAAPFSQILKKANRMERDRMCVNVRDSPQPSLRCVGTASSKPYSSRIARTQ